MKFIARKRIPGRRWQVTHFTNSPDAQCPHDARLMFQWAGVKDIDDVCHGSQAAQLNTATVGAVEVFGDAEIVRKQFVINAAERYTTAGAFLRTFPNYSDVGKLLLSVGLPLAWAPTKRCPRCKSDKVYYYTVGAPGTGHGWHCDECGRDFENVCRILSPAEVY
jgi:hypothetical protein